MREIKIQAWDKKEKRMFQVMQWTWMSCAGTDLIPHDHKLSGFYISGENHGRHKSWKQRSDVILREYTGLKDKNGVEIYERDIVEWVSTHNGATQNKHIDEVRWMDDGWYCLYPWIHEIGAAEMLVIGNIYENPELLEEEK